MNTAATITRLAQITAALLGFEPFDFSASAFDAEGDGPELGLDTVVAVYRVSTSEERIYSGAEWFGGLVGDLQAGRFGNGPRH